MPSSSKPFTLLFAAALGLSSATAGVLTVATAVGPGPGGFIGQVNKGGLTAAAGYTAPTTGTPPSVDTGWSASADLPHGILRAKVSGSNTGDDPTLDHIDQTAIAWFGSTITYSGIPAAQFGASFRITGDYSHASTGSGYVINSSVAQLYVLAPGSFDQACIGCGAGGVYTWGVGPEFQDNPYFSYGKLQGTVAFGDTVNFLIPLPLGSTPSGFQVILLLQPYIVAGLGGSNRTPGSSVSYTMDMGKTLHFQMGVPAGIAANVAGAPPTYQTVPEPGAALLVLAPLALGLLRVRRV